MHVLAEEFGKGSKTGGKGSPKKKAGSLKKKLQK